MSEKKRKRDSQGKAERPHKKVAIASPANQDTVKISLLQDLDEWTPLLASTPGISLPPNTPFKAYTKPRQQTHSSSTPPKEILLHSASHPKLDHVAREEDTEKGQGSLKHYVGVYDPQTDTLKLVPTRKVVIRSILKSTAPTDQNEDEPPPSQGLNARNELGLTFGTKKSQKAIRSLTENAISPSKAKANGALGATASAVMDSMAASTADMPSRDDMQAQVLANKPVPTPNLEAKTAKEVYTLDSLVGLETLRRMQVKEWIDKENSGEEIITKSRFVSARIAGLVKDDEVKKLRGLKYLLLLVQWYGALRKVSGKGKASHRVPKKEEWETVLPGWDKEAIQEVGRRFAENGFEVNKWHLNLLLTHIQALALVIDNCSTDVHDIRDDLHLDNKGISSLYAELGAPVSAPTEAELRKMHMTKTEAKQSGHRIARLKLPLQFPKLRVLGAKGPRR